jgi:hypothetical protein
LKTGAATGRHSPPRTIVSGFDIPRNWDVPNIASELR